MNLDNLQFNEYQTKLTEDLLNELPKEVKEQLIELINTVPYIQRLISIDRKRARDLPKDKDGKIIVDLANPHILEDMDYFRPSALFFKKHGKYTLLKPNGNPNSEYGKWLRTERDRCWKGYVRESDGEWIPGPLYFYINYCPIILSNIIEGTKKAQRVVDFPEIWEGIYLRFHYMHQARHGGLYNDFKGGNHCAELASRGKAFAYSQEVETPNGKVLWKDIKIGDSLFSIDGSTTKVVDIPYDSMSDVYKIIFKDGRKVLTTKEHLWKFYKNGKIWNKLYTTEEVLNSNRITRFAVPKITAVNYSYQEVPITPYLLGLMLGDGSFTISKYNQAQFSSNQSDVVEYEKKLGITFKKIKNTKYNWLIPYKNFGDKAKILGLNNVVSNNKFIPKCYLYNTKEIRLEVLKGLLDTDGSIHNGGKPEFYTSSKQLALDVLFLCRSLGYITSISKKSSYYTYKGNKKQGKDCYIVYIQSNDLLFGLERKNRLCGKLQGKNLKQTLSSNIKSVEFSHKEMCKCVTVDREDGMFLIGDFIPTHNSKSYSMASVLTHNFILGENEESNKNVASAVTAYQKEYLIKDGVLNKFLSMADFNAEHTQFPRKRLKNSLQEMNWEMGYKDADLNIDKGTRNSVLGVSSKDDTSKLRGKRSVFIGVEEYGTFPRLLDLYNVLLPSVQDGDYVFGLLYLQGTAGDNESDFAGAQEIMYNPKGYNMYHIPNIYDKITQGKPFFIYFFPGYLNRKGCYNKDGVSDVIAALIEILEHRHTVKHNSSDPNTILKIVAEVPITPSEAILKIGGNYFPIKDLTERLGELDSNPREMDDIYVGELILDKLGQPQFKITSNSPIRDFPHKDNKIEGAVEIYKMPEKNADGKVYTDRYIVGCDPYDDDTSTTLSLGSYYVLDLWTDQIVAEYTGRPLLANDFYEIGRRLTLFFNAKMNYENNKKGLFAYFSQMNCLYLLTDTLEFLKDQDYVKGTTYGNKAKGVNANAAINNYARMLIRNWLLKPMKFQHIVDGEETEVLLPTLYKLKCRALLKELILYNQEGNFDRVSALGMLMLYREDKMIMYQGDFSKNRKDEREADYLGNDPFFKR